MFHYFPRKCPCVFDCLIHHNSFLSSVISLHLDLSILFYFIFKTILIPSSKCPISHPFSSTPLHSPPPLSHHSIPLLVLSVFFMNCASFILLSHSFTLTIPTFANLCYLFSTLPNGLFLHSSRLFRLPIALPSTLSFLPVTHPPIVSPPLSQQYPPPTSVHPLPR